MIDLSQVKLDVELAWLGSEFYAPDGITVGLLPAIHGRYPERVIIEIRGYCDGSGVLPSTLEVIQRAYEMQGLCPDEYVIDVRTFPATEADPLGACIVRTWAKEEPELTRSEIATRAGEYLVALAESAPVTVSQRTRLNLACATLAAFIEAERDVTLDPYFGADSERR